MDGFTTIYDLTRFPGGGPGLLLLLAAAALAPRPLVALRAGGRPARPLETVAARALAISGWAAAFLLVVFCVARLTLAAVWAFDYRIGQYETLEGCAHDFTRMRTPMRVVDTFSLGARRFRVTEGGWLWGPSVDAASGEPPAADVRLRMFLSRGAPRRIDRLPDACDGR